MARVWHQFHASQVYGADSLSVMRSGARWLTLLSMGWALARWRRMRPRSLLDNTPLEKLLVKMVPLVRLPRLIRKGHLTALAVTASSYSSGEHVTFFESAAQVLPWVRSQRKAASDRITHEHLLASSAIPFIFPAKGITVDGHTEYFGDGSMRQSAPIAPAIHLGAERILVIGQYLDQIDELAETLGVGTCCGRCRECAQNVLQDASAPAPSPRPATPRWPRSRGTRCPTSSWTRSRWTWSGCSASTRRWRSSPPRRAP